MMCRAKTLTSLLLIGAMTSGVLAQDVTDARQKQSGQSQNGQIQNGQTQNGQSQNGQDRNRQDQVRADEKDLLKQQELIVQRARREAAEAQLRAAEIDKLLQADMERRYQTVVRRQQTLTKGTYLGITASPVTPALREQLKLQRGVGLVVDHLDSASPAEAAGIKKYDVIEKINDQILMNSNQMAVLVRTFKADEEVKITLIRQGERKVITAKLVEKDVPELDNNGWDNPYIQPGKGQPKGMGGGGVRINMKPAPPAGLAGGTGTIYSKFKPSTAEANQLAFADNELVLTISTEPDGERTAMALDAATGKIVYSGPVGTVEQRKEMPASVAARVAMAEQSPKPGKNALVAASDQNRRLKLSDGQYTLELTVTSARLPILVALDGEKELFNGAFDIKHDLKKLPTALRERIDRLSWRGMLELAARHDDATPALTPLAR